MHQSRRVVTLFLAVSAVLFMAIPASVRATDEHEEHATDHGESHDVHHYHHHHLALFLGASTPAKEPSHTSFAIGADYEYRFTETLGIGPAVDFVMGKHAREALAVAGLFIHPSGGWRLYIAPGAEFVEKEEEEGHETTTKREASFVIRLGIDHAFHAGGISISPALNVDLIGEMKTTFVYGVAFGKGF